MNFKKDKKLDPELQKYSQPDMPSESDIVAAEERRKKSRKLKYGALATTITILFLVAVVVVNVIVGILSEKFPLSVDLTENQAFNLTSDSIEFVQGLDKDVTIYVLNDEASFKSGGSYFTQALSVINQYAKYSDRIKVNYINLDKNPTFATNYPDASLSTNGVLITCGNEYKALTVTDLFETQSAYYRTYILASQAEQAMTSALLNVTSDEKVKVSFLTGYEEADYSAFKTLLENNGYEVVEQNILSEDIDPEAKLAVLFAPANDYDEASLNKLDKFLTNDEKYGKNVVYAVNSMAQSEEKTNLNSFLKQWNMQVGDGLVFETNTQYLWNLQQGDIFTAFNEYVDETYQQGLKTTQSLVTVPRSAPIEIEESSSVKTLIQFSETSGVYPLDADENWTPTEEDITGPIPAVAVSSKSASVDGDITSSNVAVIGSYMALNEQILSYNAFNNSAYFLNMFNTLCDKEQGITIESKTVGGDQMAVSAQQAMIYNVVFTFVLPIAVLALGIVIWARRRNR